MPRRKRGIDFGGLPAASTVLDSASWDWAESVEKGASAYLSGWEGSGGKSWADTQRFTSQLSLGDCSSVSPFDFPLPPLAQLDFQLLLCPPPCPAPGQLGLRLPVPPRYQDLPSFLVPYSAAPWTPWLLAHVSSESPSVPPNGDNSTGAQSPSPDAPCPGHCPWWPPFGFGTLASSFVSLTTIGPPS